MCVRVQQSKAVEVSLCIALVVSARQIERSLNDIIQCGMHCNSLFFLFLVSEFSLHVSGFYKSSNWAQSFLIWHPALTSSARTSLIFRSLTTDSFLYFLSVSSLQEASSSVNLLWSCWLLLLWALSSSWRSCSVCCWSLLCNWKKVHYATAFPL